MKIHMQLSLFLIKTIKDDSLWENDREIINVWALSSSKQFPIEQSLINLEEVESWISHGGVWISSVYNFGWGHKGFEW